MDSEKNRKIMHGEKTAKAYRGSRGTTIVIERVING